MYKYARFNDTTKIKDAINLKHEITDVESDYKTLYPLHYAIKNKNQNLIELLLSIINVKDHINKKDNQGKIPAEYKNIVI